MTIAPIRYVEPVYRPPSEADSLILPVTDGCSWNGCTFCEMYTAPQKRFRPRGEQEVFESIRRCGEQFGVGLKRVFLADGDAMTLSTRRLAAVLEAIRRDLPGVRRVSSYCLPRNLRKKSAAELRELAELTHIPVTTTLMGLGAFPSHHPLSLGMLGMHGSYATNMSICNCDLLVAIGARFDDRVTGRLNGFATGARKIQFDVDPSEVNKNVHVDLSLVGDAREALEALVDVLKSRKAAPTPSSSNRTTPSSWSVRATAGWLM